MEIHIASIEQLPLIVPLFDQYRMFYKQPSDQDGAAQYLRARMEHKEAVVFLATLSGEAAGFTQLYPTFSSVSMEPVLILNDLFVAQPYRKMGIGEALLGKAQAYCNENRFKGLSLETATDNRAQYLYERLGWVRDSHCFHYFWKAGQ